MGCCHSAGNRQDLPKPQYSWDVREKPDPTKYIISGLEGGVVGRTPGEIRGEQFLIQNCKNCTILLFDYSATVTIDDCVDCVIFVGPCKGSVFVRDSTGCWCVVAAQQFRVRGCHHCKIQLICPTQPIIESSSDVAFGCFQCSYPQLREQFKSADLSLYCNQWSQIHDFTTGTENCNWTLLPLETVASINVLEGDTLAAVGASYSPNSSIVPLTTGPRQKPSGEVSLVSFFEVDNAEESVLQFVHQLRQQQPPLALVQCAEAVLKKEDATRLFADDPALSSKALKGRCVLLEVCGEGAVKVCRRLGVGPDVYVSPTLQQGESDVKTFENYMAMRLTMQ